MNTTQTLTRPLTIADVTAMAAKIAENRDWCERNDEPSAMWLFEAAINAVLAGTATERDISLVKAFRPQDAV